MPTYTPAQAEAIACLDEPLQIIACAGSGKTQVISQRIAAILAQPGVEPRNVIAFTFTEKAAAELKERDLLDRRAARAATGSGLAEMYIGTMHGYCLDLLQRLVPETFKFSVLTDITARLLVDRYSRQVRADRAARPARAGTPTLRRYIHSKLYLQVLSVLREDKVDWDRVPAGVIESSFERLHDAAPRELATSTTPDHPLRRRATSKVTRTRTTTARASRITSGTTSATSSSTSIRTSTRCRSDSSGA